jgi:hypothetical protein
MSSRGKVLVGVFVLVVSIAGSVSSGVGPAVGQVDVAGAPSDGGKNVGASDNGTTVAKPGLADFEGRKLDLSKGWDQAKACVVAQDAKLLECFRTAKDAEARVETLKADYGTYWCSSPLRLFEHGDHAGRQLMFYDRGYVQDLPDYGFNDQTSSFIVGACTSYLAEHTGLAGAWYPGSTAWAWVPAMIPGWNDRISSIYIT